LAPETGNSFHPSASLGLSIPAPLRWTPANDARSIGWRLLLIATCVAAAYTVLWALGMASYHQAPPLDNAEQLVWSYAMEGGYWKHPPLPSWIMYGLVHAFGPSVTLTLFAAQACSAVALLLLWRLGCEFMSPRLSFAAAVLTALIGYHGWSAETFNHNSALLPFQAGATLFFWLALRRGRFYLWGLAGLCAGLALLVKYVAVLPLAALLLYFVLDRRAHTARNFMGLLLATTVAGLLFAPHFVWLRANGFMPIRYAQAVSVPLTSLADWARNLAGFVGGQAALLLPFALAIAWMLRARRSHGASVAVTAPRERLFLWIVGLGPLLMVLLWGAVTRHEIVPRWGHNVFLLAGWLALDAIRWPERRVHTLLRVGLAAHVALWVTVVLVIPRVAEWCQWQGRANFPGRELTAEAESTWRSHTGQPLRIVVSDIWLAGTLVAYSDQPLAVLADGELTHAAWVSREDLRACGALVVQDRTEPFDDPVPGVSRYLKTAQTTGEWTLAWAPSRGWRRPWGSTSHIAWGIIPPEPGGHCTL
jgi:4-amino-4-deoxy-L-arabinose transferase-like glycosyltransferase